jgi:hypothetical protein
MLMSRLFLGSLFLGSLLLGGSLLSLGAAARADEIEEFGVETSSPVNQQRPEPRDESWYYHPTTEPTAYKPNPTQLVQQRAMARAAQRDARLASSAWYGVYNGRPTTAATPFCSPLYSPMWQSPNRNGMSWRPSAPVYIVTGRPTYSVR